MVPTEGLTQNVAKLMGDLISQFCGDFQLDDCLSKHHLIITQALVDIWQA